MDKKELQAHINLLDDPNNEVFQVVQQNLSNQGTDIVPELEKAWENSLNELFQERIENIIQEIQFQSIQKKLSKWADSGGNDLLEGAFLIAKYQYPDIKFEDIVKNIDTIKHDVWLELNENLTALEKVKILNHIIFDVHGFTRNSSDFHSPQNSYINYVLDEKKGNPIALSMIYATVAQKLELPIYGVNLPKNFILAYKDEITSPVLRSERKGEIKAFDKDDNQDVLFYINPFNKGAVFGKREIDYFIKQQRLEPQKSYYLPCNNLEIIHQLLLNLIHSYEILGDSDKIIAFEQLLKIVSK